LKRGQGGYCNLFWDKDSEEKEKGIITESPIKNLWSYFIVEKNEKKIGLLIFPNIITQQWGYSSGISWIFRKKIVCKRNGVKVKKLSKIDSCNVIQK
jgi:hypothetical protein